MTNNPRTVKKIIKPEWIENAKSLAKSARSLFPDVYKLALEFPPTLAPLADQMVRATNSVGANIQEKIGHQNRYLPPKVLCNGLHIARGELYELKSHLQNAKDVEALPAESYENLISRMSSLNKALTQLIDTIAPHAYN